MIELPDDDPDAMTFVLRWLYSFSFEECAEDASVSKARNRFLLYVSVFSLADKYDLKELQKSSLAKVRDATADFIDYKDGKDVDDNQDWNWLAICTTPELQKLAVDILQKCDAYLKAHPDVLEKIVKDYPGIATKLMLKKSPSEPAKSQPSARAEMAAKAHNKSPVSGRVDKVSKWFANFPLVKEAPEFCTIVLGLCFCSPGCCLGTLWLPFWGLCCFQRIGSCEERPDDGLCVKSIKFPYVMLRECPCCS